MVAILPAGTLLLKNEPVLSVHFTIPDKRFQFDFMSVLTFSSCSDI